MNRPLDESTAAEAVASTATLWDAARTEQNLVVTHQRIRARTRKRRAVLSVGAALMVAASIILAFGLHGRAKLTASPPVAARDAEVTRFADGSTARVVDSEGELTVQQATDTTIEVVLGSGVAEFEVTPNPARSFIVQAGDVAVRVIGTRFRVERSGGRTRVAVERGQVEVGWPDGRARLVAGESRWFPPPAEPTKHQGTEPEAPPVPPESSSSAPERERFLSHARRGEYQAAYALLAENPDAVGSSPEDLMLAADAARLSGHPEQATSYLRRLTREHARDSRAPLAAFTLGRILMSQLSRPAQAADAFALARRLQPEGALSEDALAREAEAAFLAGDRARSASLTKQYAAHYPNGRHLSAMQKMDASPR
jgi:transmembrane sensor